MPWFYIWLGGFIGWALCRVTTPETQELFRRDAYHARLRSRYFGPVFLTFMMCVGMALWPLWILAVLCGALEYFKRLNARINTISQVHCVACGLESQMSCPQKAMSWTQIPAGWLVNDEYEVACSAECAHAYDHRPPVVHEHEARIH